MAKGGELPQVVSMHAGCHGARLWVRRVTAALVLLAGFLSACAGPALRGVRGALAIGLLAFPALFLPVCASARASTVAQDVNVHLWCGPRAVLFTRDSSYEPDRGLFRYDLSTGRSERLATSIYALPEACSPDGSWIIHRHGRKGSLWRSVSSASGGKLTASQWSGWVWSPDGQSVLGWPPVLDQARSDTKGFSSAFPIAVVLPPIRPLEAAWLPGRRAVLLRVQDGPGTGARVVQAEWPPSEGRFGPPSSVTFSVGKREHSDVRAIAATDGGLIFGILPRGTEAAGELVVCDMPVEGRLHCRAHLANVHSYQVSRNGLVLIAATSDKRCGGVWLQKPAGQGDWRCWPGQKIDAALSSDGRFLAYQICVQAGDDPCARRQLNIVEVSDY